ncbi:chaperonin 10-like protein [Xylogone sp. PMI_703]|nr:chaperonin 10-like protein [Xylogone sp. PMI_703]
MGSIGTHKAAILYGAQDLRIEDRTTVPPEDHQVQVQVHATGICGTDLHYFENGRNGIYVVKDPLTLGHEAAGEITAVGKNVTGFKVGDRVVVEPQRPCEKCLVCRKGRYNLCAEMKFTGSASAVPPVQGSLQQFYNHAASFVYRLPDNISYPEAALIEPLAVALHSVRRSGLETGQSVLILGAGAVGLLCATAAKVAGASNVNIIDIDQGRLDFALGKGKNNKSRAVADNAYQIPMLPNKGESRTDFAARIAEESMGQPGFGLADVVFECTGVDTCVNIGIQCCKAGGKVVLVGMGTPIQNLNIGFAAVHEVDLLGIWRYANTFGTAIELMRTGQIDLNPMVTHTFDLEKVSDALKFVLSRPDNLVKCVITS